MWSFRDILFLHEVTKDEFPSLPPPFQEFSRVPFLFYSQVKISDFCWARTLILGFPWCFLLIWPSFFRLVSSRMFVWPATRWCTCSVGINTKENLLAKQVLATSFFFPRCVYVSVCVEFWNLLETDIYFLLICFIFRFFNSITLLEASDFRFSVGRKEKKESEVVLSACILHLPAVYINPYKHVLHFSFLQRGGEGGGGGVWLWGVEEAEEKGLKFCVSFFDCTVNETVYFMFATAPIYIST